MGLGWSTRIARNSTRLSNTQGSSSAPLLKTPGDASDIASDFVVIIASATLHPNFKRTKRLGLRAGRQGISLGVWRSRPLIFLRRQMQVCLLHSHPHPRLSKTPTHICSIYTAPTSTNVRLAIKIGQLPDRKYPPSRSAEVRNPHSGVCLWTSSASHPGPSLILLLQNDIDVHCSSSLGLGLINCIRRFHGLSAFLIRTCGGSTTQR